MVRLACLPFGKQRSHDSVSAVHVDTRVEHVAEQDALFDLAKACDCFVSR